MCWPSRGPGWQGQGVGCRGKMPPSPGKCRPAQGRGLGKEALLIQPLQCWLHVVDPAELGNLAGRSGSFWAPQAACCFLQGLVAVCCPVFSKCLLCTDEVSSLHL